MYALKIVFVQPFRFLITTCGVALCVVLMLFLLGIYTGVSSGSVEYIRSSDTDIWVLQRHTTNILRSTSLLRSAYENRLVELEGIAAASPGIFVLTSIRLPHGTRTLYLAGYDRESGRGGPPEIYQGRTLRADDEIVLDRAFAIKNQIQVGDAIIIKNDTLQVVGLSQKTNMIVIQYAFVSLAETRRILGFGGIVSCFMVKLQPGQDRQEAAHAIEELLPDVVTFDRETFLQNNIREMETGILPLLYMVALLGSVVLTAILSLILSVNVLERRKDYAIMKALGAPAGFVQGQVVLQSLILSCSGLLLGIVALVPVIRLLAFLAPEVSILTSPEHLVATAAGVLVISLLSSVFPIQKLRKVYPMEVFQ